MHHELVMDCVRRWSSPCGDGELRFSTASICRSVYPACTVAMCFRNEPGWWKLAWHSRHEIFTPIQDTGESVWMWPWAGGSECGQERWQRVVPRQRDGHLHVQHDNGSAGVDRGRAGADRGRAG